MSSVGDLQQGQREAWGAKRATMIAWWSLESLATLFKIMPACAAPSTTTMLRYRATEYDLVMIGKKRLGHIVVEVREKNGNFRHKLRFITSYKESGVLFILNAHVWGQLDFIAFEPDTPCLLNLQCVATSASPDLQGDEP